MPTEPKTTAKVRVIIVNYNSGAYLARCAAALGRQSHGDFEAVIVDNGSADGSVEALGTLDSRFRIERLDDNIGFAAANNRAALTAETEWIATLNPDAFPRPDWLRRLLAATERHGDVDMFGSTQIDAARPDRLDGTGDAYFAAGFPWRGNYGHPLAELPDEGEAFAPCAAAALYRASAFAAAGGFDERFFCYCEDVDIGFRLRLGGSRCIQVADAVVDHVGGGSSTPSAAVQYHSARNRVWLMVKNVPLALLVPMVPVHLLGTLVLAVKALWRGNLGPLWRGVRDALRGLGPVLADRRQVQARRRASTWCMARAVCWSPLRFLRRAHDVRPL